MKYTLLSLALLLTACAPPKIEQNADGSVTASAGGMVFTGQLIFIEKQGHTFAVYMNDHGAVAMVEGQPR